MGSSSVEDGGLLRRRQTCQLMTVGRAHRLLAVSGRTSARSGQCARVAPEVSRSFIGFEASHELAHAMFDMSIVQWSTKVRSGTGQWIAEVVATAGLLPVILRAPNGCASSMMAAYIGAAYWFTASTSFANSAAAFGRMFSNSFAGIVPGSVARVRAG